MGKTVLIAVDIDSTAEASIRYGIELAARMRFSPVLLAISDAHSTVKQGREQRLPRRHESNWNTWQDLAVAESQLKGLDLEVFVTSGRFSDEVIRFVRSRPAVQFIIIAAPRHLNREGKPMSSLELKYLHEQCESEILLVEKAGQVTRVSDLYARRSEKENPE